ncbi:phosphoribosylaminoimidazolesuccinocarboxamide synthase [Helicobacter zhangjianzhongii]|uniref:Phosphoribosylaminoimidazolesuccinocarboxamide synthase n=1 Tax=Helicobacter zhangjianzhongii TaxID=2974574 RepID=A0ACC6FUK0_9HELI|nr:MULTISPECIES: phosphoribosylaminoimidazolesuccinocarboxamide synthase [unclassified Helicobacter]MDL0080897.1 phosphoribosylaminoimidazolesuccinocarboxamide synthase [Helicobacter sp. CPD2-1]MDL0082931.1 phosphoribosylaminoimidazolesuccinocarboxamide synthase [Helicobacter sp. XJK30-2]
MLTQQALLYEGKGKKLFATENPNEVIAEFKDDLTAFNAQKRSSEDGKGALNCLISSILFNLLAQKGIKSHFIQSLSSTTMLCQKVQIIPIEVVVRNIATGSLSKRLGIEDGLVLPFTLVEFYYKDDALNDPIINDEHCKILGIVDDENDLSFLRDQARKINAILRDFFDQRGLKLVDFKLEFGRNAQGEIILADEISPDSCRLWDKQTNQKLDKDRFRQDLGDLKGAYEEVLRRIQNNFS